MSGVFIDLTVVIVLASFLSILFRFLKLPIILAYIFTGIILGPFGKLDMVGGDALSSMAQIGITLLLFMIGLEFRLKDLRSIGIPAVLIGTFQIVLTTVLGTGVGLLLKFPLFLSLLIGIGLTFSSTIIVVKLLSDKKDLESLYGKLSVAILLLQDVFAIFILILLSVSATQTGQSPMTSVVLALFKAIVLFGFVYLLSTYVFPKILTHIARSQETLFLFSLAWVFGFASLVSSDIIHFPIEIGGFLAGLALSGSSEHFQIIARVKSLRDFFITIFFVTLGLQTSFANMSTLLLPLLVLLAFVILLKPFLVSLLMGVAGYKKHTAFLTGMQFGQVSEFSLIVLFTVAKVSPQAQQIVPLMTLVGIISFAVSSYIIGNDKMLYRKINKYLFFIERPHTREEIEGSDTDTLSKMTKHVILVGVNRIGNSILEALVDEKEPVVVVDFNPDVIRKLRSEKVTAVFGDIADPEIQQRAGIERAKLIISTVSDIADNLVLLSHIKKANHRVKIVVAAAESRDAKELYKKGADYVLMPHLIGGRHVAKIIRDDDWDKLSSYRAKDEKYIRH